MQNLVPFGYYLVRRSHKKILPPCCPVEYFSLGGCLCEAVIPDTDNIPISPSHFNSEEMATKWNITIEAANALYQFNAAHIDAINYPMLNYKKFDIAMQIKKIFFPNRDDISLIGVGALDHDLLANSDIQQVSPLPPEGKILGFDLYEFGDLRPKNTEHKKPDYTRINIMGLGCSICCCDSPGDIPKRLGAHLNNFGLYPDAEIASKAAELVNTEHLGEPMWYLPLGLIQYESFRGEM